MSEGNDIIFWRDGDFGECQGGYYVRNDLKEFFQVLESKGIEPVGIKFDGSYTLEIIVKKKQ